MGYSTQLGYNNSVVLTEAFEPLIGAHLRRLDSPASDVLALSFSGQPSGHVLLVRFRGPALGLGLVSERPRGAAATATVTRFRHHLQGARLVAVEPLGASAVRLRLEHGPRQLWLEIFLVTKAGNCIVRDGESQRVLIEWHRQGPVSASQGGPPLSASHAQLLEFGAKIARSLQVSAVDPATQMVTLALERRVRSLKRRTQAIEADLLRADQVSQLRGDANLLLTHRHQLAGASGDVELIDTSIEPPPIRHLTLSPGRTAQQQAEQWFMRARKFERGAVIAQERLTLTNKELTRLQELLNGLERGANHEELAQITQEARSLGVSGLGVGTHPISLGAGTQGRRPYHEYQSSTGHTLLVGRGAKDNDALTLHVAQPQDMFVHVRGYHGAHVIARLRRGEICPPETLLDAATLAAHFSDARNEDRAEVSYTQRRYVRKPRGAAAGAVVLAKEKVIHLRFEPMRLRRLLASKRVQ